ncbi:MAG: aldo/keto reductase [Anaerolineae bacterium]|nr:aldo/keto reductase [Anaerolineae bacterium]
MSTRATPEGTRRFAERQPAARQSNYRQAVDGLWLSSLGHGTYLGEPDDATDHAYRAAFTASLAHGCNVFDCAINYRYQRSERVLGAWLREMFDSGALSRDEVVVATKGGFVPYDGVPPDDPRVYAYEQYIKTGYAKAHEFAARYQHCIAPAYLEQMIALSLENLGLECIDIYYLHNPETQSIAISAQTFRARLLDAFETLELAVERGQIASYGLATWTAFRALPDSPDYLSLTQMVSLAAEVGGQSHNLRYVQLPYNLFMTEAYAFENQQLGESFLSAIEAANQLGLTVMVSAPLMQGRLSAIGSPKIAAAFPELRSKAQQALQFVRSTPGVCTALIGMARAAHVSENLALTDLPPADSALIRALYDRA